MKIGLQIPNFTWPGGNANLGNKLGQIARIVDDAGFYSLWVMDHFFQIASVGPAENEMLEAYSTLGFLAGQTKKIKLGAMVTGVVYRYPGILIKTVTTLDVLSGGRAYFGIGAAWNEREALALGVPFPPIAERFEKLEETLQIGQQMWSDNNGPYNGKHFQLQETLCIPQPLSKPHPPILIGGGGEKKTLKLIAKYADACNFFAALGADALKHKLEVLNLHCAKLGRNPREIEKTALGTVHLAPDKMAVKDVIEMCRTMAAIGFTHLIFNMPNLYDVTPLETFGREIIPEVAHL